jgi:HTH-type transcriptional regulator/antitoxin HigA
MNAAKKLIDTLKQDVNYPEQSLDPLYFELVKVFPLETITSARQHEMALRIIEKLITFINDENCKDRWATIYLRTLSNLVEDYERTRYKSEKVTGAEMLLYLMELQGLNQSDLSEDLGGQSVVSKILSGERKLNLRQIKTLSERFAVSPEVFI